MTVYNPTVTVGQSSKTYISIQNTFNKPSDGTDEIQAGWIVSKRTFNLIFFGCRYQLKQFFSSKHLTNPINAD